MSLKSSVVWLEACGCELEWLGGKTALQALLCGAVSEFGVQRLARAYPVSLGRVCVGLVSSYFLKCSCIQCRL